MTTKHLNTYVNRVVISISLSFRYISGPKSHFQFRPWFMETQLRQNCYSSIGFHMSVLISYICYESNNLFIYVHVEISRGF